MFSLATSFRIFALYLGSVPAMEILFPVNDKRIKTRYSEGPRNNFPIDAIKLLW